jgi:hypothetical protein
MRPAARPATLLLALSLCGPAAAGDRVPGERSMRYAAPTFLSPAVNRQASVHGPC